MLRTVSSLTKVCRFLTCKGLWSANISARDEFLLSADIASIALNFHLTVMSYGPKSMTLFAAELLRTTAMSRSIRQPQQAVAIARSINRVGNPAYAFEELVGWKCVHLRQFEYPPGTPHRPRAVDRKLAKSPAR